MGEASLLLHGRGITASEIARHLGLSKAYISQQLGGHRRLKQATLDAIFDLSTDYDLVASVEMAAEESWGRLHPVSDIQHWVMINGKRRRVAESELIDFYIRAHQTRSGVR